MRTPGEKQSKSATSSSLAGLLANSGRRDSRRQAQPVDAATKGSATSRKHARSARRGSADVLREQGLALVAQGDYAGAAAKLREALELEPDDPDSYKTYNALADALVDADRHGEALQRWSEAVAIGEKAQSRTRRIVLRDWGSALREQKDYAGAAAKLREALELEPDDPDSYEAYNALADALAKASQFEEEVRREEAVAIGEKAKSRNRRIVLRAWGGALGGREDYAGAAAKLRGALELDPDDPDSYEAYNALANALVKAKRFSKATQYCEEAVALGEKAHSKNRRIVLRGWGDRLINEGRLDESLGKYLRALVLGPYEWQTHDRFNRLARAFAQVGRFEESKAVFDKAKEKLGLETATYALRDWGWTLHSLGFPDEAAETIRQGLKASPHDAECHNILGLVLKDQGHSDRAIEQFRRSNELFQAHESKSRKFPLSNWADALVDLERFTEAVERAKQAIEADPDDFVRYFNYAGVLSQSGRPKDALVALGQAIERDREHPYSHHNRANLLFELGNYKEGWGEWRLARDGYPRALDKAVERSDDLERADLARYFGNVMAVVFNDYPAAEKYFTIAISLRNYDDATWRDFAIAYQAWANADEPPSDIQARLSPALETAIRLTKRRLGKGNDFPALLALADLHIATQDWKAGSSSLEQAAALCQDSRLRRAEVDRRQGLLELRAEHYSDAVESFRKAITVRHSDLELRSDFGKALMRAKRFVEARDQFNKVLKYAPGHIDALIGLAQVCIELADEGETEYYQQAELRLSQALRHGRDASTGSVRLQGSSLEDALYLRGFVRTKRWEAEGKMALPVMLFAALRDFSQCKHHAQAPTARTKIKKYLMRTVLESFLAKLGAYAMFTAMAAVFVLVQLDFFFHGYGLLSPKKGIEDPLTYGTLTFGSFLFMIAALYLPDLLKLKVPGIELEKTAANQVSSPSSLGISRPGGLTS